MVNAYGSPTFNQEFTGMNLKNIVDECNYQIVHKMNEENQLNKF